MIKKRLKEQARDKYRNVSEEDTNKKREYGRNRYHLMSEEKKQKISKNIRKITLRLKSLNIQFDSVCCDSC